MVGYIIGNGEEWLANLKNGSYYICTNKDNACCWTKLTRAENVLRDLKNNFLIKDRNFSVHIYKNDEVIDINESKVVEPVVLDFDLKNYVSQLSNNVTLLEKRKKYLISELSEVDKNICDILHCAEFYQLDVFRGYKLYKILHETRIARREIKNELESINSILGHKINSKDIDNADKSIYGIYNNKSYAPRVVDDLFDLLK